MKTYTLELCGVKRELPLTAVGRTTQLANFSLLGDVELTRLIAKELSLKFKSLTFDCFVGPEVKVVPLLQELAGQLDYKKYVVCRKSIKPGMLAPIILKPLPHFPKHVKQLVLDGRDATFLKGKKVIIIDDVISTGVTMRMMTHLMTKVGAEVVLMAAVLKQGKQFDKFDNLLTIGELPVFKTM
jgi:adenine phosphoribosyltransferase